MIILRWPRKCGVPLLSFILRINFISHLIRTTKRMCVGLSSEPSLAVLRSPRRSCVTYFTCRGYSAIVILGPSNYLPLARTAGSWLCLVLHFQVSMRLRIGWRASRLSQRMHSDFYRLTTRLRNRAPTFLAISSFEPVALAGQFHLKHLRH